MKTDFGKISNYADFVHQDPFRNYLHYPAIEQLVPFLASQKILDVGCGDGQFAADIAGKYAMTVVGYDIAPEKISEAQKYTEVNQDVSFCVATPQTFTSSESFDHAYSVLVLPYAADLSDLSDFFTHTKKFLNREGVFASIVFNPDFSHFDNRIGSRWFEKLSDNLVRVHFLSGGGGEQFTSQLKQFSRDKYKTAAEQGGMQIEWFDLRPNIYTETYDQEFWIPVERFQPYQLVMARIL